MAKKTYPSDAKRPEYERRYRNTPHGAAMTAWFKLNHRAGKARGYKHVEVRMTKEEFLVWAVPEYERWFEAHPVRDNADTRPSVDRKDSRGHYEISNLRLISHRSNCKGARTVNTEAPEGTKWCPACQQFIPHAGFYKSNNKSAGPWKLSIHCKACDDERRRKTREQTLLRRAQQQTIPLEAE